MGKARAKAGVNNNMTKGRRVGQIEVSLDEIGRIIELTNQGAFRKEIADELGRSTHTIWRYQKQFC
jgi:DNA invertase Pin-like site-specific DNA recombinase